MLVFIGGSSDPLSGLHKNSKSLCDAENVNASMLQFTLLSQIGLLLKSSWSLEKSCFVLRLEVLVLRVQPLQVYHKSTLQNSSREWGTGPTKRNHVLFHQLPSTKGSRSLPLHPTYPLNTHRNLFHQFKLLNEKVGEKRDCPEATSLVPEMREGNTIKKNKTQWPVFFLISLKQQNKMKISLLF